MAAATDIERFALFGETGPIVPEFLHVETISARSSLHDWEIRSHAHPDIFQLLLLERGTGRLTLDGAAAALEPSALVLLPIGCVHGFAFAPDAEGWVLSIAGPLLHDRRIAAFLDNPAFARGASGGMTGLDAAHGRQLGELLGQLAATPPGGLLAGSQAARLALILALAGEWLAGGSGPAAMPSGPALLAARFREHVELHFRDGWSVARHAAALGTTVPTLTRACRAALGKPPAAHVHDRMLLEAMRLLTYSAASVAQVGASLGFDDPAYFARFFRARAGMTAGDFRRRRAWLDPALAGALQRDAVGRGGKARERRDRTSGRPDAIDRPDVG